MKIKPGFIQLQFIRHGFEQHPAAVYTTKPMNNRTVRKSEGRFTRLTAGGLVRFMQWIPG